MNLVARAIFGLVAAIASTLVASAAGARVELPEPIGPDPVTVVLDIEHSRFEPSYVRVAEGTPVRFVVRNADPINHELIAGPPEVHVRHSQGTEAFHPPVPGEVSVPALEQAVTTYTFDTPGHVLYACHLPGHLAYGMRGVVEVVAAPS